MQKIGLTWEKIVELLPMITKIAHKYAKDPDLADDVVQEVCLALYQEKIDWSSTDPNKEDALLRTIIRNLTKDVLNPRRSPKGGSRLPFASLDKFVENGAQLDEEGNLLFPKGMYTEIRDYEGEVKDDY